MGEEDAGSDRDVEGGDPALDGDGDEGVASFANGLGEALFFISKGKDNIAVPIKIVDGGRGLSCCAYDPESFFLQIIEASFKIHHHGYRQINAPARRAPENQGGDRG